jgi:hypothetical protein
MKSMSTHFQCSIFKALPLAVLLAGAAALQAQISVNLGVNPTITFATTPPASEWATSTNSAGIGLQVGGAGAIANPGALDTAANLVDQSTVTDALPAFTGGFGANARARHKSDAGLIVFQATAVPAVVVKATLRNTSGSTMTGLRVQYLYNLHGGVPTGGSEDTEVPGLRAYYSATGSPGSWTFIPEFTVGLGIASTNVSAILPVSWADGTDMYLMWLDDNTSSNPDGTNSIANVVFTGMVDTCVGIDGNPQDLTVAERGAVSFSLIATGTPQNIRWYRSDDGGTVYNEILGATASTYAFPSAAYPADNGAKFYATVSNSLCQATSTVATLTVNPDTNAPTVLSATGNPDLTTITVTFSEPMESTSVQETLNYALNADGGGSLNIIGAVLANGTNITLTTDPRTVGENYTLTVSSGDSITDNSSQANILAETNIQIRQIVQLVGFDTDNVWSYFVSTNVDLWATEPGWMTNGFDDSAWLTGQAGLGVDASVNGVPIRTPIDFSGALAAANRFSEPAFFRRHFTMPAFLPSTITLRLRHVFEDGAVVFLNGQEAARINVAAGAALNFTTRTIGTAADPTPISAYVTLPLTNVVVGDNVIAIVVIQSGATSSDCEMAAELTLDAIRFPTGPATIITHPIASTNVNEGQPFTLTGGAFGAIPLHVQWRKDGVDLPGQNSDSLVVLAAIPTDQGNYTLVASNASGMATSTVAAVTVNGDNTAPVFISALSSTNGTNITLTFSEPLTDASATNTANYSVHLRAGGGALTVHHATVVNNTNVILHTDPVLVGQNYAVTTAGLVDRSFAANAVTPSSRDLVQTIVVFPFSHTWKYLENGSDQGTAFYGLAYDDSGWLSGNGILGFEDSLNVLTLFTNIAGGSGTNTVLSLTNDVGGGIGGTNVTIYFRGSANISNFDPNAAGNTLYARYYIDDGAAVYVNGAAQMFFNLTNPTTYTNFAVAGSTENTLVVSNITGFVQGFNLIAAEVHQSSLASSDIDWGMQLEAFVTTFTPGAPRLSISMSGSDVTITWDPASGTLQYRDDLVTDTWHDVSPQPPAGGPYVTPASGTHKFWRVRP